MKKVLIALGSLAILVGLVCRTILLNISFEYDEIFTAITSNPTIALHYIWKHYLIVDVHPPLHNLFLWCYNHLVPYGPEWVLRLPSLFISFLGIFLAWKLFPRYLSRTTRWLFLLLISCNFYLLLYAQHARAYSFMFFFALLLTFLYLNMARKIRQHHPISLEYWISYAVCSLLLCWNHYFGALLFGILSVILFIYAWKHKQPLRAFILVPLLVLAGFLPWMIPNLLQNLSQHRFSGNWWGNRALSWDLIFLWMEFFFSSRKAFYILLGLGIIGSGYSLLRYKRITRYPYVREIILLFIPMATALTFALLMSFKIFWLLWRYFIPFVPCLYLLVALIITPLCKRFRVTGLIFLCFVGLSFHAFIRAYPYFQTGRFFPARFAMQAYRDAFPDKDLYVIALEAFPVESMQPMYAFYPKQYFHMDKDVYELFHMDPAQRESLMARHEQALLWMPNCDPSKMKTFVSTFQRNMAIFAHAYGSCFMVPAGADRRTVNPKQNEEYIRRFKKYQASKRTKN